MGLASALRVREKNSLKEAKEFVGEANSDSLSSNSRINPGIFVLLSGRLIFRPYQFENHALLIAIQRGIDPTGDA